ncbi:SKIP/SNW domain-containing protein [Dipodascopsis uninucleata]
MDGLSTALVGRVNARVPPYGKRSGWRPRTLDDYGDGGAFPEIHMNQYPLDMGREKQSSSNALAIQVNSEGKIKYDAIARQGHSSKRIIQTSFSDLIPLRQRANIGEINLARPSEEEIAETASRTKAAIEAIVAGKTKAAQTKSLSDSQSREATYIRYTPSSMMGEPSGTEHRQRIIKMVDLPEDPMAPPKFKHTKVPRGPPSPPAPLLRSPPRKLSAKDQEEFSIPPSVSKWKNPKGYTIALDKRLAADGRGLEDVKINDNFAKFSEALYAADRHAREEVRQRALIQERIADKEKEEKEEHLRMLALKVRQERGQTLRKDRRESPGAVTPKRRSASPGRSTYSASLSPSPVRERGRPRERFSGSRSYSRTPSVSRSRSVTPRSLSRTPSYYSRTPSRSRSLSRSPRPSRGRSSRRYTPLSRSPSRSSFRSYSRSRSRTTGSAYSRSRSRGRSLSRSISLSPRSPPSRSPSPVRVRRKRTARDESESPPRTAPPPPRAMSYRRRD